MAESRGMHSIGVVERDTGIGRDTLRVWERRYGFPRPQRNDKGERIYPEQQLRQLQRIRRLLDQGLRPGKLLPLSEAALDEIEAGLLPDADDATSAEVAAIIHALHTGQAGQVQSELEQAYQHAGMRGFITGTVIPLLKAVGESWARGQLQIYQEHFLSQLLIRFINVKITSLQENARKPCVLLATLPGEEHSLGLLMVAALLSDHGVAVINLGSEVPMDQIENAVNQFHADIVGVTFSGAYPYKNIRPHLLELRSLINDDVDIWVGGEGIRRLRKLPVGVTKINSLEKLPL